MRTLASLGGAAALLLCTFISKAVTADAEALLWNTVSPYISQDARAVMSGDGASLKASSLMKRFKPKLFDLNRGLARQIEETCKLDLEASAANAVVVTTKDEEPNLYVETRGLGLNRIKTCIKDLAARKGDSAAFSQKGSIIQATVGKSDKVYFGWLNNKILVTSGELDNRDKLSRAVSRAKKRFDKRSDVAALLARVDRSATAWGLYVEPSTSTSRDSDKPQRAFGMLNSKGSQVAGEVHLFFASGEIAAKNAKKLNRELAEAKRDAAKDDKSGPAQSRILAAAKITSTENEVVGTATATQSDAIAVIEPAIEHR